MMSLDVAYSYCFNLTEEEKFEMHEKKIGFSIELDKIHLNEIEEENIICLKKTTICLSLLYLVFYELSVQFHMTNWAANIQFIHKKMECW